MTDEPDHLVPLVFDASMPDEHSRPIIGYWMHETTGRLAEAMQAYLAGQPITAEQIAWIRAYLRQWMQAEWHGPDVAYLREAIDGLTTRRAIDRWLSRAELSSIDPL